MDQRFYCSTSVSFVPTMSDLGDCIFDMRLAQARLITVTNCMPPEHFKQIPLNLSIKSRYIIDIYDK